MTFSYYRRLSSKQKLVYRRSDAVANIRLPRPAALRPLVGKLQTSLSREDRPTTTKLCQELATGVTQRLEIRPVRVVVYAVRPSADWGELHGLYEAPAGRKAPVISLWMRTAKRRQVVAFRTFFRTLLHEVCHHIDFELLGLPDSFHTEGFYKRESSLFHQLVVTSR